MVQTHKHKRIRTVRQYSGGLARPRGMYFKGKELDDTTLRWCNGRVDYMLESMHYLGLGTINIFKHVSVLNSQSVLRNDVTLYAVARWVWDLFLVEFFRLVLCPAGS